MVGRDSADGDRRPAARPYTVDARMPRRRREDRDQQVETTDDDLVGKVAKALGHPARVVFIDALHDGAARSPVQVAERHGGKLGTIGHHARVLEDLGVLILVETRPVRGAIEHFYSLEGPLVAPVLAALDIIRATEDRMSAESR